MAAPDPLHESRDTASAVPNGERGNPFPAVVRDAAGHLPVSVRPSKIARTQAEQMMNANIAEEKAQTLRRNLDAYGGFLVRVAKAFAIACAGVAMIVAPVDFPAVLDRSISWWMGKAAMPDPNSEERTMITRSGNEPGKAKVLPVVNELGPSVSQNRLLNEFHSVPKAAADSTKK